MDKGRLSQSRRLLDAFDKPTTLPKMNELPGSGNWEDAINNSARRN
jgi:hypothetical protein